LGTPPRKDS